MGNGCKRANPGKHCHKLLRSRQNISQHEIHFATNLNEPYMVDQLFELSNNFGLDAILVLLALVSLESVLSADNALALASLSGGLENEKLQQRALNLGLMLAYAMRIFLIVTATWVIQYWQFELVGALYLLWLAYKHFTSKEYTEGHHHGPRFNSLWQAIPAIALTDLAFSLDSVTTAIAISDELWLVLTGATLGIIILRFMAELFIRWLQEYVHLEDAGYITVGLVGMRLLVRVVDDSLTPPQWLMVSLIALIFIWGFSERTDQAQTMDSESDVTNKL